MTVLISLRWQRTLLEKASDYKFNKYKIDRTAYIRAYCYAEQVCSLNLLAYFKAAYLNTVTGIPYEVIRILKLAKVILYTKGRT